ncbi:hypothetical protein RXV86_20180 [Alisedimentitalea sp. MJ-SS2]|uniref:hypothetical protein n=1 Tax=Aliisedimentitalea sp. MJ-SS2 TaxID=3049795 RepID=UPI00290E04D4|nr:hypothetical protein [Alisedimentitalea sp. MJ-SS2]MDU8929710.1 hypothetical protein [Alisedimentitalea sp. MJ-SS2]
MLSRITGFARLHWQGQVALLPTVLLTLLGLRLGVSGLSRMRPVEWPLVAFALFTLASAGLLIWQVVGTWRAARREKSGMAAGGALAGIGAATVLFGVAELDSYAARGADTGGLPPVMPLPVAGQTAFVEGTMTWPLYNRFCTTLLFHPDLEVISLTSEGGLVPVARAFAARIAENGLDTQAVGLCASACTLAFMAGHNRGLGPEGALGFHGYALLGYVPASSIAEEEARDRVWLKERGVDPGFIAKVFATSHDQLWRPSREMLEAAGVLTGGNGRADAIREALSCGPLPGQAASP